MDTALVVDSRLSEKVIYDKKPTSDFKEFCKYAIDKIYRNSDGRKLIDKISEFLKESSIKNVIFLNCSGDGGGTAFVHKIDFTMEKIADVQIDVLFIHINLDNAIRCVSSGAWCEQLFGISECVYDYKEIDKIGNVFRIAKMLTPFYVTIAHEFIHLKHFLETLLRKKCHMTYEEAVTIETYNQITRNIESLPELREREYLVKREIPWSNFEERRTVVGPDIDGISELSFRIKEGLPIRYIYQGPDNCFYEEPKILYTVVSEALSIAVDKAENIVMDSLPKGYLSEDGMDFVKFSTYHPLRIQLALYGKDRIIRSHNKKITGKAKEFLEGPPPE